MWLCNLKVTKKSSFVQCFQLKVMNTLTSLLHSWKREGSPPTKWSTDLNTCLNTKASDPSLPPTRNV